MGMLPLERCVLTLSAHFLNHMSALAHSSVRNSPLERARHEMFFSVRFMGAAGAAACIPMFILLGGMPSLMQGIAFVCMVMPLFSVVTLSRTGNLLPAQVISVVSMLGFASALIAGAGVPIEAAVAWLVLIPIECALLLEGAATVVAGIVALFAAAFLSLGAQYGILPRYDFSASQHAAFSMPAIVYAIWIGIAAVRLTEITNVALTNQTTDYETLSSTIGDLVVRTDRFGAVLKASDDCVELFNISPQELSGRGMFERIHVSDRPLYLKTISDAASQNKTTVAGVVRLRIGRGHADTAQSGPVFRWVEMRARSYETLADDRDYAKVKKLEVIAMLRDITDNVTRMEETQKARLESEQAVAWKDRFLANVSHELRTPLNAIIGFSDMLAQEELAPKDPVKAREYAAIVRNSGQHLLEVVNTILDMSKIEAGGYELDVEPFDIQQIIEQTCAMVQLRAESGKVSLVKNLSPILTQIKADRRSVRQILLNLVTNAVKFTPPQGIVTVATRPDGNHILIEVTDTGIGISDTDLKLLGRPFFQASSQLNRTHEGTGLGLSVVRGLVGLHDGQIRIESSPGQGTKVTVRLPIENTAHRVRANAMANIEILANYQSGTAHNLKQAVETFEMRDRA